MLFCYNEGQEALMSYKALYRTYRPHSFDTVVGQKHIVQTLQNALKNNKMSHAYLFCGPRGTGKTTVAKLVAKSVNCLNPEKAPCNECEHCRTIQNGTHPDVIEIDAASNNGVDEIRDLIEKVKYAPLQAKYKVYIIDEVHMLSQGAFNALLKTLEEPPAHVIFILATTEPHKVLPTIISRCQRYDFVRVSMKEIQERIEKVLKTEKIEFESEATRLISQLADGGVRDALSILEQCIAYGGKHLTTQHVNDIYGIATTQDKLRLLDAVINKDVAYLMNEVEEITQKNIDIRRLTNDLMELLKESVVFAYTKDVKLLNKLTPEEAKNLNRIPQTVGLKMIEDLMETAEKYRSASNLLSYFEIGLLKVMGEIEGHSETLHLEPKPIVKAKVEPGVEKAAVEKVEPLIEAPTDKDVEAEVVETRKPQADQFAKEEIAPDVEIKTEAVESSVLLQSRNIEIEHILEFFVSGDKQQRADLTKDWSKIQTKKFDVEWGRLANLLMDTEVRAANQDFVAVSSVDDMIVDEINSLDQQEDFKSFMKAMFDQERQVFAMTQNAYDLALIEFKTRMAKNSLPKPKSFKIESLESSLPQKDNIEEGLFKLFGEENVEIV